MSKREVPDWIVKKLKYAFLQTKTEIEFRPSKFVEDDPCWLIQKESIIKSYELLAKKILRISNDELRKNVKITYGIEMAYCNREFEDSQSIHRYSYVTYSLIYPESNKLFYDDIKIYHPIESRLRIYSPFSTCTAANVAPDAKIIIDSNTYLLWNIANTNYKPRKLSAKLVNTFDHFMGNYPLTLAISKGHIHHQNRQSDRQSQSEIIEQLLPYADLHLREFRYGLTPLEIAIMRGDNIDFIKKLFELGPKLVPNNLETLMAIDYEIMKARIISMTCYNTEMTYDETTVCTVPSYEIFLKNREKIRLFFKTYES